MADKSDEAKLRAEAQFKKKEHQAQEAEKVWAEEAAAAKAGDQKRAGLRSLRLAKEEADRQAGADRVPAKGRKKPGEPKMG